MGNDNSEKNLESAKPSSDKPKVEKSVEEANAGRKEENVRLAVRAKQEVNSTEAGPLTKEGVKRMAIVDDGVDLVKKGGAGRAGKDAAGQGDKKSDKNEGEDRNKEIAEQNVTGKAADSNKESSENTEGKKDIAAKAVSKDKNKDVQDRSDGAELGCERKDVAIKSERNTESEPQAKPEISKEKPKDKARNKSEKTAEEDRKILEKLSAPRNTKTSTVFGSPEIAYNGEVVKEAVEPKSASSLELPEHLKTEKIINPTERIDENTGVKYSYDQQRRITEFKTPEGRTSTFEYTGDAIQPSSFQMNDKDGKPVLKLEGEFQIDKDGVVTQLHELPDSNGAKLETRFSPNGVATKTHYDGAGRRISAEQSEATSNGIKILGKTEFLYSDDKGMPTQDSDKIDDSKPVQAITHDDQVRVTERYQYASTQALEDSRPSTRQEITYAENPALHTASEKHIGYAYHPETGVAQQVVSSEKIRFTDIGITAIHNKQANGVEQHMQFDKDGKALALTRFEYDQDGKQHNFNFNIKDGKIVDTLKDNIALEGEAAEQAKKIGEFLLAQSKDQNNIEQRAEAKIDRSLTPPREGETPSGTLVWKDGDKLRQASVEAGTIKDDNGKAIGTVNDRGTVSFNDRAAKSFKISESEGAAFHGVGSDTARLDLAPAKASESYSGAIVAADGTQKYSVVGGNLYDSSSGKFYAQLDQTGKLHFPNDVPPPTNVNSQLAGHKFLGEENGKPRVMDCSANAPSGKIFIPDEKTGTPQEFEVRMGMILNKSTHEQMGILKAPSETADGRLIGGTITMSGEAPKELADFKKAVFDLSLNEEGNRQSRRILGASQGHIERMADGTPKPGQGGLFNIQNAFDTQKNKVDTAEAKLAEQQRFLNRASGITGKNSEVENARDMAHLQADETNRLLRNMLETGQTNRLEYVEQITAGAKDYGIEDELILKRRQIDHSGKNLEDLPTDTKQLNGTLRLPQDHDAAGLHEVKDGKVLGSNGKPIGTIDSATGEMTWLDKQSGQARKISMKDLDGAVWNLAYKDGNGAAKKIAWISQGDRGIVSINDLKAKAAQEVLYASLVNSKAQSDLSAKNAKLTEANANAFNERLDRIAKEGLQDGDAQFLSDGASRFVRTPEATDGHVNGSVNQPAPRQRIEIPELGNDNIQDVNGDLRIGSQVFKIDHGQLREVHYKDGKAVVDEKASGQLGANYTVELPGRHIDLARENRVLMQFTVGNKAEKHQIIGLGPGRQTAEKGFQSGGLIESKELLRRSMEIRQKANEGNSDYFASKPWISGTLIDMSGTYEEREQHLKTYSDRLDKTVKDVEQRSDILFQQGFNPDELYNNKLDASIDVTQNLMDYIGATATASKDSASEYKAAQKEIVEATAMAAITVATAGAGYVLSAAVTAGRITAGAAYVAELGTGVLTGSALSVTLRASDNSNWRDNAIAGGLEGGAMAFGSVFGKAIGAINDVTQLKKLADMKNAALTAEQAALLNMGVGKLALKGYSEMQIKAAYYSSRVVDSAVSTVAFTVANEVKERGLDYVMQHKIETLQKGDILAGTAWNLAGQAVGHAFGSLAMNAAKGRESNLARAFQENGIGNRMLNDTVNSFTNAGLGAMNSAYESERERIGQELGIDKNLVTGALLRERANYANIIGTMAEAGWNGALSAPLMAVATHPFVAAAEHAVKKQPTEHATQSRDHAAATPGVHGEGVDLASSTQSTREKVQSQHETKGAERSKRVSGASYVEASAVKSSTKPAEGIIHAQDGKTVAAEDTHGRRASFEYDVQQTDAAPSKVKLSDGTVFERHGSDEYKIHYPEGHPKHGETPELIKGRVIVDKDGGIGIGDNIEFRKLRPDGNFEKRSSPEFLEHLSGSDKLRDQVDRALLDLPISYRNLQADKGVKVIVAENLADLPLSPKIQQIAASMEAEAGAKFLADFKLDNVLSTAGGFDSTSKTIAVAENTAHVGFNAANDNIAGLTRHEFGHAISWTNGSDAVAKFSGSDDFQKALALDRKRLLKQPEIAKQLEYFTGNPDEVFAEVFGSLYGGGGKGDSRLVLNAFRETAAEVRNQLKHLDPNLAKFPKPGGVKERLAFPRSAESRVGQAPAAGEAQLHSTPEVNVRSEPRAVSEAPHKVMGPRPQKGSLIEFNGQQHTLVAYDSKTGDAILRQPGAEAVAPTRAPVDLETNSNYTKLRVDRQTYYRDSEGKFHRQFQVNGEHFLIQEPELKSVPSDQISQKLEKKAELVNPPAMPSEGFLNGRDLYLNGNKVDGVGREFSIGRTHQPDVFNEKVFLNVSRDHLTLRQDDDGRLFVKDTSSEGTYREKSDGTWERLPKGQEVSLGPSDKLRLGSEHGAELNFKDRGSLTPSRNQPSTNLTKGSQVEYGGNKYFVSGFDRSNGDIVLCRPNYGKEYALESVPLTPDFKPLQLGKETYYKGTDGSMYRKLVVDDREVLIRNWDLQAVPRDRKSEIKLAGAAQLDQIKKLDKPEPEIRMLTPKEIRRRFDGEYLTLYLGKESSTEMQAMLQTNEMATKHIVTEPLHDGFQLSNYEGFGVSSDGRMHDDYSPNVVIDRTQDTVLNRVIEQAHAKFDHLKSDPRRLATELTKFAKEIMHPKGWSEYQLDQAYSDKFEKVYAGKRLLLGEIINRAEQNEFGGVCAQQALLLKVLGDRYGIETKMIIGSYEPRKSDGTIDEAYASPHAWTEMKIDGTWQLFDPRHKIYGEPPEKHPDHAFFQDLPDARNARYLEDFGGMERGLRRVASAKPQPLPQEFGLNLNHGDKVDCLGLKDWIIMGHNQASSTVLISRDGTLTNSREELRKLNPAVREFKIGEQYTARNSQTRLPETGWTLIGLDSDNHPILTKKNGFSLSVDAAALLPSQKTLRLPDIHQMILQNSKIDFGKPQEGTFGSRHRIMNADLILPNGQTQKVLFHTADNIEEGPGVIDRFRKEMACYKINRLLCLENGFPTTAPRDAVFNGKKTTGFIQDKSGIPFDKEIINLSKGHGPPDSAQAVSKLLSSDNALESQIEQAFVERLIYGCADNIAGNFVIVQDGQQLKVRNIDLDLAFKNDRTVQELVSSSEADRHGVSQYVRDHFSEKDISPALLKKLDMFVRRYDNEAGIQILCLTGLDEGEVKAMIVRAKWFVSNRRFPKP